MEIRDFSKGQTAYIVGGGVRERKGISVEKVEVAKVGRKYVTIAGNWGERFREVYGRVQPYLIEQTEIGTPRLLFPTKEAVNEYREREELKEWVREMAGWDKIGRYTLGQLRAVKMILEGEENNA